MIDLEPANLVKALHVDLKQKLLKSELLREVAAHFFCEGKGQEWNWNAKRFATDICHTYLDEQSGQELSVSYRSSSDRVYLMDAERTWLVAFSDRVRSQSMGEDTDEVTWFGKSEIDTIHGSSDSLARLLMLKRLASTQATHAGNLGSLLAEA